MSIVSVSLLAQHPGLDTQHNMEGRNRRGMKWRRRRRRRRRGGKKGENEEEAEGEDKRRKREWRLLCMHVHVCQEMP